MFLSNEFLFFNEFLMLFQHFVSSSVVLIKLKKKKKTFKKLLSYWLKINQKPNIVKSVKEKFQKMKGRCGFDVSDNFWLKKLMQECKF